MLSSVATCLKTVKCSLDKGGFFYESFKILEYESWLFSALILVKRHLVPIDSRGINTKLFKKIATDIPNVFQIVFHSSYAICLCEEKTLGKTKLFLPLYPGFVKTLLLSIMYIEMLFHPIFVELSCFQ